MRKPVTLLCRQVRYYTHTLLVLTHFMTTAKEIFLSTYKQVKLKFLKTQDLENDDFNHDHNPNIYKIHIYYAYFFIKQLTIHKCTLS